MWKFINDLDTYDQRLVGRFENESVVVDTVFASDGKLPFETGISHADYNNGKWVIVEAYSTKELATEGHNRWVETMSKEPLPSFLADCANAKMCEILFENELGPIYYRNTCKDLVVT